MDALVVLFHLDHYACFASHVKERSSRVVFSSRLGDYYQIFLCSVQALHLPWMGNPMYILIHLMKWGRNQILHGHYFVGNLVFLFRELLVILQSSIVDLAIVDLE